MLLCLEFSQCGNLQSCRSPWLCLLNFEGHPRNLCGKSRPDVRRKESKDSMADFRTPGSGTWRNLSVTHVHLIESSFLWCTVTTSQAIWWHKYEGLEPKLMWKWLTHARLNFLSLMHVKEHPWSCIRTNQNLLAEYPPNFWIIQPNKFLCRIQKPDFTLMRYNCALDNCNQKVLCKRFKKLPRHIPGYAPPSTFIMLCSLPKCSCKGFEGSLNYVMRVFTRKLHPFTEKNIQMSCTFSMRPSV